MTDIVVTAAQVAETRPDAHLVDTMIANEAITAGQAVYRMSTNKAALTAAGSAGTTGCRGIALETVGAGAPVTVLKQGPIAGFAVSLLNADAPIYVSNTAGALADAAGTTSKIVGRVRAFAEADNTLRYTLWLDLPEN